MKDRAVFLAATLLLLPACDWLKENTPAPIGELGLELAEKAEDEIFDRLVCEDKLRPSTADRIRDLLQNPNEETVTALLTAGDDLAEIVSLAGTKVEGTLLLARNFALLSEQGHLENLLQNGLDGLTCEDEITLACTAGSGTTTVGCDDSDEVNGVSIEFDACMLDGTKHEGQIATSVYADEERFDLTLVDFTLDEVQSFNGELRIDGGDDADLKQLTQVTTTLEVESYGGLDSELSCGSRSALETLRIEERTASWSVEVEGEVSTKKGTYGLRSIDEHLVAPVPLACTCPQPGSGLEIDFPRPFSGGEALSTLRIRYAETGDEDHCASVTVEALDWPTGCPDLEEQDLSGDCGRSAVENTVAELLGSFCVPLSE